MPIPVEFQRQAVALPPLGLWLDAHIRRVGPERVFVSHAHSDHTAAHREVLLTEPTARFMRVRLRGTRRENVLRFGETREFSGPETSFHITLLPAGHILGSAMALIEVDGERLFYTGDFKLRPGLCAEPCDPTPAYGCDLLIMETTFGRPAYCFPPVADVMTDIIQFCHEALRADAIPVLLGYSLGKAQELLVGLADSGLSLMVHDSVRKMTKVYEQCGVSFPRYTEFDNAGARGRVLIAPPPFQRSELFRALGPTRTALVSGWALDPRSRYRYGVDAAFPLSDHADFPDLIEFVRRVAPKRVFTLHGFAADFAATLRERGCEAWALGMAEQLTLPLQLTRNSPPATGRCTV